MATIRSRRSRSTWCEERRSGSSRTLRLKELLREAFDERVERFAIQRERRRVGRPRQLEAARHRRHPDLTHGSVGADDEFRRGWFLEHDLQDAVLQLHFEAVLVGHLLKRVLQMFEREVR